MTYQVTDQEKIRHRVDSDEIKNNLVLIKNTPDKNIPNNIKNPDDYPLDAALQDSRTPSGSFVLKFYQSKYPQMSKESEICLHFVLLREVTPGYDLVVRRML
jgi:hypothetical protein